MNCAICKVNKIGPKTAPFGGYLCGNEHMQCGECNDRTYGQCGLCKARTFFVQMNFNQRCKDISPMRRTFLTSLGPVATSPSMDTENRSVAAATLETDSSYIFPKAFYTDMETQSSISQEQLSMHESHDSISMSEDQGETNQFLAEGRNFLPLQYRTLVSGHIFDENAESTADATAIRATTATADATMSPSPNPISMSIPIPMSQYLPKAQERIQMETIFFGNNNSPQSASNFIFPFRTENGFMRLIQQRDSNKPELEVIEAPKSLQLTTERTNACDVSCGGGCDSVEERKEKVTHSCAEDTEDVIHTSEIRFMESTESMKNYFSGGTMHPILKAKQESPTSTTANSHHYQPQESISIKKLHAFESHNTAHPTDLVESYLRNYGPLALCQFPAYSFSYSCQENTCATVDGLHDRRQSIVQSQTQPNQTRTVSASTESEPTLASTKKCEFPAKYLPPDYFVMQATGVAAPTSETLPNPEKVERSSIDIRMQKVLETFQEDPCTPNISEKPLIEQTKKYLKIMDPSQPPQVVNPPISLENDKPLDLTSTCEIVTAEKSSLDIMAQLSNTHRAFYNPPSGQPINAHELNNFHCPEPPPQFQLVTCSNIMAADLLLNKSRFINIKPIPACHLTIPRPPIKCPESSCQRMIFVSDFNKHLIVDHSLLPMERIAPRQCKNFFLDPKLSHCGISKCHLLYLIRDKITDLGSSKFKDFLPMLVMSTRIRLSDLCGIRAHEHPKFFESEANTEYLMIWLTGIVPEEFPVGISLTVWSRSGKVPTCHIVHSGEIYSVRQSQDIKEVWRSGQMLLLSASDLQLLTNGGKEMLELQIIVH
ncbi:uncharacterized protein LOC129242584 [Anastrepha obliqua]|uniref:uncharacterized protein LOC129242584 n=1 Tax=Anastrepha obliqua TaxID=95512 RepID=UPI002408FF42|nr:uncharacterized protein LOC129242584 [Anastrepha obliqua]